MPFMPDHITTQTLSRVSVFKNTLVSLHKEPLILRRRVTRIALIDTKKTLLAAPSTKKVHQEIAEGKSISNIEGSQNANSNLSYP
jgi:hypothetical protein